MMRTPSLKQLILEKPRSTWSSEDTFSFKFSNMGRGWGEACDADPESAFFE
jgi:hypothetical protein